VTGEGCPEATCWAISGDSENYYCGEPTKEAAIEEGRCLYPDSSFWVGRCVKPTQPEDFWRAEDWLEHVACQDEYSTDWAEGWDDGITKGQMQELESAVRKIMGEWLDRHKLRPRFYGIEDAEKIQPNDQGHGRRDHGTKTENG
jgi:hypothetical protein